MPFCPNCGHEVAEDASFCSNCGANLNAAQDSAPKQAEEPKQEPVQEPVPEPIPEPKQEAGQTYTSPAVSAASAPLQARNIVLYVVLSLITCGIFSLVWMYLLVEDLNKASDNPSAPNGIMVILFNILTCGIYGYYWYWKAGEAVNRVREKRGEAKDSNTSILYLILAIVGLAIVNMVLIQDELNKSAAQN